MQKVKYDFASELNAHTSALLSYYPPERFCGLIILTMMPTHIKSCLRGQKPEKGFFEYYDKQKDEIIKIDDVPG